MTATHGEGAYGNAAGVTTNTEHKMAQTGEVVKSTTANVVRPGLFFNNATSIATGRANMAYDVAPFTIVTQRSATAGVMKWANDATVTVSTTAAPGSNSRYDVVYAWHREYALDGTNSDPVIGVVQGTSAAVPSVPSLSAFPGAVELARVLVPSGVTATNSGTTFTHTAPFTALDGAPIPVRNATERDAISNPIQGALARRLDADYTERYYSLYNVSTNPTGAKTAGWYPQPGSGPRFWAAATVTQVLAGGANTINGTTFPAGSVQELLGFTSFSSATLTVLTEGDYDVIFNAYMVAGNALVFVDGVQKVTGPSSTQSTAVGVIRCNAGSVITMRTFSSGGGNFNPDGTSGSSQLTVKWRGIRRA